MEEEDSRGKALGSLRSIFKVYSKGKGMLLKGLSKGLSRTKFRLGKDNSGYCAENGREWGGDPGRVTI